MSDLLPLLLEPEALHCAQKNQAIKLIQVTGAEAYAQAHIAGALLVQPAELVSGEPPAAGKLPDVERLNALFSRLGLSSDDHLVVYDDEGGGWAGRFIWTLDIIGHANYSYLNGGLHAWYDAGLPLVAQATPAPAPSDYQVTLNESRRAKLEEIIPRLGADDFAIWDARSKEEHDGTRLVAQRGGHIPGAAWFEWTDMMDRSRALRLKDLDSIRNHLDKLGLTPDKEIVTHCQSHHRSGLSYLVGRILDYPRIKAYDGSWSEWGNRPDTPIE